MSVSIWSACSTGAGSVLGEAAGGTLLNTGVGAAPGLFPQVAEIRPAAPLALPGVAQLQAESQQIIQTLEGSLDSSDPFNPTRFRRFYDDTLLKIDWAGTVEVRLESDQFDPLLQVLDDLTGAILYEDDDSGGGLNSRVVFEVEAGDRFWLRTTSYWRREEGSYRLSTTLTFDDPLLPSPPLEPPAEIAPPEPGESGSELAELDAIAPDPANFDRASGYGLINAGAAVAAATGGFAVPMPERGGLDWDLDLINVPSAWAQGATGEGVVVAVIDSGLDIDHPDLRDSLWVNPGEIAGDGIDNDGNGYIDDIHGWNFGLGQNNGNVRPGTRSDFQGHGTHVAGIVAANDDGVGNTGVAPDAQIMPLRLGDTTFFGSFRNAGSLVDAIYYAVDNGADVINLSLGWSNSAALQAALAYAAENNVVTVSASGNAGGLSPVIPAVYADRWGISVGAVDRMGQRAFFSNQAGLNPAIRHVLAPGSEIYSTQPNESYQRRDGTSMAVPFVSGTIALMLSVNPDLTADQIRNILTATAA